MRFILRRVYNNVYIIVYIALSIIACMRNLKDTNPEEDDGLYFPRFHRESTTIQCPACKKSTNVPNGDVGDIPKNFAYIELLDRVKELEEKKKSACKYKCSEHGDEELRYWCSEKTCLKAVCSSCLLEGNHFHHA